MKQYIAHRSIRISFSLFFVRALFFIFPIISTVGSFSIWEASAVWIESLPSLWKKERLLNMFSEAEIRYIGSGTK